MVGCAIGLVREQFELAQDLVDAVLAVNIAMQKSNTREMEISIGSRACASATQCQNRTAVRRAPR
jgi:hypothetical protein